MPTVSRSMASGMTDSSYCIALSRCHADLTNTAPSLYDSASARQLLFRRCPPWPLGLGPVAPCLQIPLVVCFCRVGGRLQTFRCLWAIALFEKVRTAKGWHQCWGHAAEAQLGHVGTLSGRGLLMLSHQLAESGQFWKKRSLSFSLFQRSRILICAGGR